MGLEPDRTQDRREASAAPPRPLSDYPDYASMVAAYQPPRPPRVPSSTRMLPPGGLAGLLIKEELG